jgi:hypothetical protein
MTPAPRSRRYRLIALIVLAGWANAGCSFLFVDGPPEKHRKMPYFECTSGRGWPIVDGVIGASVGIGVAAQMGSADNQGRSEAVIGAAEAALFLASTVYGFTKSAECREAKEALMLRLQKTAPEEAAPDPWAPRPGSPWAPKGAAAPHAAPNDPWAPPPPPPPLPPGPNSDGGAAAGETP